MTIFKMKDGKVVPIAIVKNGETSPFGGRSRRAAARCRAPAAAPAKAEAPKATRRR